MSRYEINECIYSSKNSAIYAATDTTNQERVLLKKLNADILDPTFLARVQNEYNLITKIDSEYIQKAKEFFAFEGGYCIVMEYHEEMPLAEYIRKHSISVKEFLHIARKIVNGIADIHKAGIIHKDINPSNIIYDPRTRKAIIIDFGLATEFSFERPQEISLNGFEGTLPYVSPEQTGRMNRAVDLRTDFYSLGVTFFEMLCGRRPFEIESPTELIYSHIAKIPPTAKQTNPQVPEMLSRIISRLMEKMPEKRYFHADGILFDLDRCLSELDAKGEIAEFELGMGDYSDKFEIPQKLYGREKESALLIEAYRRIEKGGKTFVAIGGFSGVGKTSLVGELHKPIVNSQGIFIDGKFDQYHRNVPYYVLSQAVGHFCEMILSENEKTVNVWKARLENALGKDGRLLIDKVPRLSLLMGNSESLPELSPVEERAKVKAAIQNLIIAIAAPERPLVLFIDDIHLADMGSFELLEAIMGNEKINGLLIIVCFRDNEVDEGHPLLHSLQKMANRGVDVQRITLAGLIPEDATRMLAEAFHRDVSSVAELAGVIYSKTHGNPFYIKQFLKLCHKKKFIFFDAAGKAWDWNLQSIETCPAEENVVDFLTRNMDQLSDAAMRFLSLGACIGGQFSLRTLSALAETEPELILSELKPAVSLEIICAMPSKPGQQPEIHFVFSHDRFQQTYYTRLSQSEKNNIHYSLALYYENTADRNDAQTNFIIADNYSKALGIPDEEIEKRRVCGVLLRAAKAASLSSSYDTAGRYLEQIIGFFADAYENDDEFMISVYAEYHSALCGQSRYEDADRVYELLEKYIQDPILLTDNCCLQAVSLSNRGRYKTAFLLGAALLGRMGVDFPADDLPGTINQQINVFYNELQQSNFVGIEEQQEALDRREFAIGKILNRITAAGFFHDPLYSFWALITNARRILENGYTPDSLQLYADLALVLIAFRNDYDLAYRTAWKAMKIAEKNGYKHELYRIYHVFSLFSCHWFCDVKNSIPYARESCKGNVEVGDFEFACFSYFTTQQAMLETCQNIGELRDETAAALAFAKKTDNRHAMGTFISYQQLVKSFLGETAEFGSFHDEGFSEPAHLAKISENPMALCYFYTLRALSAVIYSDFDTAFGLTEKAAPIMPSVTGFYPVATHNFLHSLAICKRLENHPCNDEERKLLLGKLDANQKWLGERAADASMNFSHLYDLIAAEKTLAENKEENSLVVFKQAFSLYEKAIRGAEQNQRISHYALACELAGIQCMRTDFMSFASIYVRESYSAYLAWGATGKTKQMTEQYGDLFHLGFNSFRVFGEALNAVKTRTGVHASSSSTTSSMDFDAVIKASQAISGEMKLETIMEKLIEVLLENSGAQEIYYLTKQNNGFVVEAEGHSEERAITIFPQYSACEERFPLKILNFAERARESVILENAAASDQFGMDGYIVSQACKSVMCMPVISKGTMQGLLYLENNLVEGAFNRKRTDVLKTIASQFAISLENAYLFNNLQQLVDERTYELREEISVRTKAEKRLEEMANHDHLTNLPNRRMFHDILTRSIEAAKLNDSRLAVLFVDLDGFKGINDRYGHDKGDLVLVTTAKRLSDEVRSCDTVSRMGGDEFILILENIKNIEEVQGICRRIIRSLRQPISLGGDGTAAVVTASVGISLLPCDGNIAEELIKNADKAMYVAKNLGKNRFVFYSEKARKETLPQIPSEQK